MSKTFELREIAARAMRNHLARFRNVGPSASSGVDVLRVICLHQQQQIELLAGLLAKLHPDEYLKAASQDCDIIGTLPDIDDEPEDDSQATEDVPYTAIYTESWQAGSHRNTTVHHRRIERFATETVKDMLTREGILDNTVFLFEGWSELEQMTP